MKVSCDQIGWCEREEAGDEGEEGIIGGGEVKLKQTRMGDPFNQVKGSRKKEGRDLLSEGSIVLRGVGVVREDCFDAVDGNGHTDTRPVCLRAKEESKEELAEEGGGRKRTGDEERRGDGLHEVDAVWEDVERRVIGEEGEEYVESIRDVVGGWREG